MSRHIAGRRELEAKLKALPPALVAAELKAMALVAAKVNAEQKALLGHDAKLRRATSWRVDGAKIELYSGSRSAYWALWTEFGTHPHSLAKGASRKRGALQDKGPHHPGEPARPYFLPPWTANVEVAKQVVAQAAEAAMRKVAEQ